MLGVRYLTPRDRPFCRCPLVTPCRPVPRLAVPVVRSGRVPTRRICRGSPHLWTPGRPAAPARYVRRETLDDSIRHECCMEGEWTAVVSGNSNDRLRCQLAICSVVVGPQYRGPPATGCAEDCQCRPVPLCDCQCPPVPLCDCQ